MRIQSLHIKGFRNLAPLSLDFTAQGSTIALVGRNGEGKTNLLEAIYLCALSKSFRSSDQSQLVGFGQDFCRIQAHAESLQGQKSLEFILAKEPLAKSLKINGTKKGALDFVGTLKVVFFSPDDLSQMAFAPALRRRYLDVLLSQLDSRNLADLSRYRQAKAQRNALLKRIRQGEAKEAELEAWDQALAQSGARIIAQRFAAIARLAPAIERHYHSLSRQKAEIVIRYSSKLQPGEGEEAFRKLLREGLARDLAFGQTHAGPHRDDVAFFMDGHDMADFASRGEWRSLILALKFSEMELMEEACGEKPVLLLDDVFSELDEQRQADLFSAIGGCQAFISTTHAEFLKGASPSSLAMYQMEAGVLRMAN